MAERVANELPIGLVDLVKEEQRDDESGKRMECCEQDLNKENQHGTTDRQQQYNGSDELEEKDEGSLGNLKESVKIGDEVRSFNWDNHEATEMTIILPTEKEGSNERNLLVMVEKEDETPSDEDENAAAKENEVSDTNDMIIEQNHSYENPGVDSENLNQNDAPKKMELCAHDNMESANLKNTTGKSHVDRKETKAVDCANPSNFDAVDDKSTAIRKRRKRDNPTEKKDISNFEKQTPSHSVYDEGFVEAGQVSSQGYLDKCTRGTDSTINRYVEANPSALCQSQFSETNSALPSMSSQTVNSDRNIQHRNMPRPESNNYPVEILRAVERYQNDGNYLVALLWSNYALECINEDQDMIDLYIKVCCNMMQLHLLLEETDMALAVYNSCVEKIPRVNDPKIISTIADIYALCVKNRREGYFDVGTGKTVLLGISDSETESEEYLSCEEPIQDCSDDPVNEH